MCVCCLSLQDYPKLSQSFYSLLEVLTQDHMNFIASLEPHVVMYILSSISEGLTALGEAWQQSGLTGTTVRSGFSPLSLSVCLFSDTMVCTGCCSSLDHIVTYLFKQLSRSTKKRPAPMATDDRFLHIMQQHPEMIQQVRPISSQLPVAARCVRSDRPSLCRPADAVHRVEHHHLRGLQESVVHVQATAGPYPAQ